MSAPHADIEIPEGAIVGSADDPTTPQPQDGDRVLILERPTLPSERPLKVGQTGVVQTRPLTNFRGRPAMALGCPWVKVDHPSPRIEAAGGRVLASRWAILPGVSVEEPS